MKKKTQKKKSFELTVVDHTLQSGIMFFIGEKKDIGKMMSKYLNKEAYSKLEKDLSCGNQRGSCCLYDTVKDNKTIITIWIDTKDIDHGLIAHEIYHAICSIMEEKGIEVCDKTEELTAYLLSFYITKLNEEMKKHGIQII